MAASVILSPAPSLQFFDNNGVPLNGGLIYAFAAGTSTPQAVYTDATGLITNTNPVVLNASGFPQDATGSQCGLWLNVNKVYKLVVCDRNNVQLYSMDGIGTIDNRTLRNGVAVIISPPSSAGLNLAQTIAVPAGFAAVNNVLRITFGARVTSALGGSGASWAVSIAGSIFDVTPTADTLPNLNDMLVASVDVIVKDVNAYTVFATSVGVSAGAAFAGGVTVAGGSTDLTQAWTLRNGCPNGTDTGAVRFEYMTCVAI